MYPNIFIVGLPAQNAPPPFFLYATKHAFKTGGKKKVYTFESISQ